MALLNQNRRQIYTLDAISINIIEGYRPRAARGLHDLVRKIDLQIVALALKRVRRVAVAGGRIDLRDLRRRQRVRSEGTERKCCVDDGLARLLDERGTGLCERHRKRIGEQREQLNLEEAVEPNRGLITVRPKIRSGDLPGLEPNEVRVAGADCGIKVVTVRQKIRGCRRVGDVGDEACLCAEIERRSPVDLSVVDGSAYA